MRPITDMIKDLDGGRTYDDLNGLLDEVTGAVIEHRKVGEITIKLKVSPNGEHAVAIIADVKGKVPEAAKGSTMFFVTAGGLSRRDPRQPDLPLREVVDNTTGEIKEVENA